MRQTDALVVGGGIAGASAACMLAEHLAVVLLEREDRFDYHTTGRSAAVFTEAYERGVVQALAVASRPFLERPPADVGERSVLRPQPFMLIGTEAQRPKVAAALAAARRLVPSAAAVGPDEVRELCPVLRPGYVAAAAIEPEAASIDVHALHEGYLGAARRRGADTRKGCGVVALERRAGRWRVTCESGEQLEAPVVVNAAGAWAEQVAELAGLAPVGLQPYRRTAFTFAAPDGLDVRGLPMVVDADERFYFEPEGDGFLGSLAEETPMAPHDVRPDEADVALAIERIQAATTMTIRHVRTAWAGLRSFVADRHPVIGEEPHAPGFHWLAGQGGFGIMTSPAAARALAGLVVDRRLPADLADLGVTEEDLSPARCR